MQTKQNVFVLLFHVFFFATYIIYDCVSVAGSFFNSDFFEGKRIESPSTRCALNALKAVLKRCFSARNTHMEHTPRNKNMTRTCIHCIDHAHIVCQTKKGRCEKKENESTHTHIHNGTSGHTKND